MQSRSTNFLIFFKKITFRLINFVHLKQFWDRNDFWSFEKRTLGYRLENRLNSQYSAGSIDLKIQVAATDTFFSVYSFYCVLIWRA